MPELPEVQALVDFLCERTAGRAIVGIELGSISVLKTYDPAPTSLHGLPISNVTRHGKFIDIDAEGLHLVFHLARAGWLRWSDALSATTIRAGKSPIALRCRLSDGSGFDLTEAGTRKRLAAYVVGVTLPRCRESHAWGRIRWLPTSRPRTSRHCSRADERRSRGC